MDAAALARRIEAIDGRRAGSDGERRAALLCVEELRRMGRRPRMQTLWFRRRLPWTHALHAALGLAGSVASVGAPVAGLGLAAAGLLLALAEAAGLPLLAMLVPRRATQTVVAPPLDEPPGGGLLILSAALDSVPGGLLERLWRRVGRPFVPGAPGLLVLALAAVCGFGAARVAGAAGAALGAAQLVPSIALLALLALFADAALAAPSGEEPAAGAAAALAAAATLDARPPRRLAVEVVLGGAGESGAPGMRAYVRRRRSELAPERVVVVHLASGPPPLRYLAREGELFGVGLHPRLGELAAALPGARRAEGRSTSAARVARGARWPAIVLEGPVAELATAAPALVAAVDAELRRTAAG